MSTEPKGLGQLIVKDPQSGSPTRMEIARCHVNVILKPPVALVQLDQSFFNPAFSQQEGTFVFNLPPGASVSRFAMFVTPDELIEGELIERKRASDIYESIVRRKRDPAILEQIGDNLFRMRVFPIFARDTKRILLDFTLPLKEQGGRYNFSLPLMSDLKPIWDFQLSGLVHPPVAPQTVVSRLNPHLEFVADEAGVVRFSSRQQHVHPPQRLDLQYASPQERVPRWRQYVPAEGPRAQQYFVASIPTSPVEVQQSSPCDLMILVDTSGSMQRLKLANHAARTLLRNLPPDSRFQLACVDDAFRPLTTIWCESTPVEIRAALARLDEQIPLGPSRLAVALRTALNELATPSEGRRRNLVYIGDGDDSSASTDWSQSLLPHLGEVVVSTIRTGNSQSGAVQLFDLSRQTGGRVFRIDHPQELEGLFLWSLSGCSSGLRISDVRIAEAPHAEVFTDPSVTPGESLYVYGRCAPREELTLSVEIDGRQQSHTFTTDDAADAADAAADEAAVFTGRLWAQRKLEAQLGAWSDPTGSQRREIIRLSQDWSLLSPYTAFLVLETEADYGRWGIDRRLRRRYWKPPEMLPALPIPEELANTEPPENDRQIDRRHRATEADLADGLQAARTALQKGEPALALRHLLPLREKARQLTSDEFDELLGEANQHLEHERILGTLGIHRRMFDLGARLPLPTSNLLSSLIGAGAVSPDFLRRHPDAPQMLKRVSPTDLKMPLTQFADLIREQTGWNVVIDEMALRDVGIPLTEEVDLRGIREITVRHLLEHALSEFGLTTHHTPHVVTITTTEIVEERQQTRVYPVVDLIRKDQRPSPESLSNPYWDLDEAFRRKAEATLDRVISVDFAEMSLADSHAWLDGHLQTNLQLNETALTDVGIQAERETVPPLRLQNVPLRVVIDTVLQPHGLTYEVDRELVKITTNEIAEESMQARLYSMVGIVYEVPRELVRDRWSWQGGFGGGGLGGGGGGAFGGGGLGGGGLGGGITGGLGGGMGLEGLGGIPTADAGISVIDAPDVSDISTETTETANPGDATPLDVGEPDTTSDDAGRLQLDSNSVIDALQSQTDGSWEDIDGIGGAIDFYAPAMALVVCQTGRVHRELTAELKMLRELPVVGQRVRPARFPVITEDTPAGWDMQNLIDLIQLQTDASWEDIDGIGGGISEHLPSMSLMISQTGRVHEEIDILLTQLRRAIIENRHRLQLLERGLPLSDIPLGTHQVNLTEWQVTSPPAPRGTDEEVEILMVRRVPPVASVRWRHTSGAAVREFTVRHSGARLEYASEDVVLRADGDGGAVRYRGLARVEIDAWGETIRRLCESALPWLPHVSNERLADLYDIEVAETAETSVTLELVYALDSDVQIKATFDRGSGQPTDWKVYVAGALQYRLRFSASDGSQIVRAIGPNEREIERWEVIASDREVDIPEVDVHPPRDLVVDRRDGDDQLFRVHQALNHYRYLEAVQLLEESLKVRPKQPLLNFLLAWTCEQGKGVVPDAANREQRALTVVLRSEAEDLIALVGAGSFPSADHDQLLAELKEVVATTSSLAILDAAVDLSLLQQDNAAALEYQTRALEMDGGATLRRRMRHIDLLAANGRLADARNAAERLSAEHPNLITLSELGDLFGRHRDLTTADAYFAEALKLSAEDSSAHVSLLLRQATWHQGPQRWRLLAKVADMEADSGIEWNSPLETILREARTPADSHVLGELAQAVRTPAAQVRLLERQAQVTDDVSQAAEICRQLLTTGRATATLENWMVQRIRQAGDDQFVIRFLEDRLARGRRLSRQDLTLLADVYEAMGQTAFARRARSDENPISMRQPNRPAGGGFF